MKFLHVSIYGFAKWHDFKLDFHPSELQVIYGENESGKSSLQQFIMFMLFGLPPKKRAFFRSKTGGKMGGMLTVFEEGIGEYTIERVDEVRNGAAKCLLPNGGEADEEWLKNRLQGITRQTYQSIFSFDALDLTPLKTMKEEDLGGVLLGIGLTGSSDIYAVEKRLDTKISELFKPFGKKPIINQQLDYLADLYNKVQEFKSTEKTYQEKTGKVAEVNQDIEGLQATIQEIKKRVSTTEKTRQARPNLIKLSRMEVKLNDFPNVIPFPKDGMKRWEAAKERILPLESELAVLQKNESTYNEKWTELKESLLDPETYTEAKELLGTQTRYNEHVRDIKSLVNEIKEYKISLKVELNNIDTRFELADLNDMSLAYQTENTWIELDKESNQLRIDKENADQEKAAQQTQKEELARTRHSLDEKSLTPEQVDELSNRIAVYNNLQHEKKYSVQDSIFEAIIKQKQKSSMNLLTGSIILGILFGIYGIFAGYIWCFGAMVIFIGAGAIQWILGNRSTKKIEQMMHHSPRQSAHLMVTLEEKVEAEELLARHDEQLRQREIIDEKLRASKIEQIKRQERNSLIRQSGSRLEEKITQQRDMYPILETIEVSNWSAFYHTFKSLLQHNAELRNKNIQLNQIKHDEANLGERIMKFFIDEKWEWKNKSMDLFFTVLQERLEEHNNTLRLLEQYETWIKTTNEQVNAMKQKLQVFQSEQIKLIKAARVKTEEQFYQANTSREEKIQTEVNKEEIIDQLSLSFSEDEIRELTMNNMPTIMDMEEKQRNYHDQLESAEQAQDKKRKDWATITADLANMESSDAHSQTMHRYDRQNAELKQLVDKWVVLKSAKEMLVETKNNYRDKYMARIIEQTSDYFAILTNHAYKSVYAPKKEQLFQVESADQLRFTVNELSQGTKDQLYIALRIAISEVMSDSHDMPFIIDDAFVHFDEIRVENMMRLTASIAKKRQVILFTCKKELTNDPSAKNVAVLSESIRKI